MGMGVREARAGAGRADRACRAAAWRSAWRARACAIPACSPPSRASRAIAWCPKRCGRRPIATPRCRSATGRRSRRRAWWPRCRRRSSCTGSETVLEVGTGSGYQAAILVAARRARGLDRARAAARRARALARSIALGVDNVLVYLGDGSAGRPQDAPFDAIVVTAGGPERAGAAARAARAGRARSSGPSARATSSGCCASAALARGGFKREVIGRCRFVDLVGAHGWAALARARRGLACAGLLRSVAGVPLACPSGGGRHPRRRSRARPSTASRATTACRSTRS